MRPSLYYTAPFTEARGRRREVVGGGSQWWNLYTNGGTSEEFTVIFPRDTKDFIALVPVVTMPYGAQS